MKYLYTTFHCNSAAMFDMSVRQTYDDIQGGVVSPHEANFTTYEFQVTNQIFSNSLHRKNRSGSIVIYIGCRLYCPLLLIYYKVHITKLWLGNIYWSRFPNNNSNNNNKMARIHKKMELAHLNFLIYTYIWKLTYIDKWSVVGCTLNQSNLGLPSRETWVQINSGVGVHKKLMFCFKMHGIFLAWNF